MKAAARPNEVRLIGGQWKRSKLPVANLPGLRPTPDRVRETLFNWLGQDLTGWRVLDAFAGSGALGFEAASRGATEVTLLERNVTLARSLTAVKERLHADAVQVMTTDALAWLARCGPRRYELVLLDPPFDSGLSEKALVAAAAAVADAGYVYLEAAQELTAAPIGLTRHRHLRAGAVHAHLFVRADLGAEG